MARGPNMYTFSLDQCQGALYQAQYVDGLSLVEFAEGMNCVFEAIESTTCIKIEVGFNQWQYLKNRWDKIWDIKNGGPSPDVRGEMLSKRSWFFKGVDGRLAYKPFNLDNITLSMLPAGLGIAVENNSQQDMAKGEHGFKGITKVGHSYEPSIETCASDLLPSRSPTASQDPLQPQRSWTSQMLLDVDNLPPNTDIAVKSQALLAENIDMYPNGISRRQQPPPIASQDGSLTAEPLLGASQLSSSPFPSGPYGDFPHPFTPSSGGGNGHEINSSAGYIDSLARSPTSLGAHSERFPKII